MGSPSLTGFAHKVVVGIADLAVSNNPNAILATHALGSCIGIALYDPQVKVGGLLHYMLPDSSLDPARARETPAMFGDTGIPALFRATYELQAEKHRLLVTVAGGAQVMDDNGFFNIGKRNYDTFLRLAQQHSLRVRATHVGGMVSRTLYLSLATGEVRLKISGQPEEILL